MSYCSAIESMTEDRKALHKAYHDNLYGFPIHDDNELFCRLVLEINQAGLSWETILKKERACFLVTVATACRILDKNTKPIHQP
jgi:3-methyladenine DNA glycosylase Tag